MSVQTEIDRIITAVGAAYDAVEAKGGTLPASETVANLAEAINSIPKDTHQGSTSETWVLNEATEFPQTMQYAVNFNSNGKRFTSISAGISSLRYGTTTVARARSRPGGVYVTSAWPTEAYRKLVFDEAPTGDLLTWLTANGVKQPANLAVQPSKDVTITSNGTTEITPDAPYDVMEKANLTVNVASGGGVGETTSLKVNIVDSSVDAVLFCLWQTSDGWIGTGNFESSTNFTIPNVIVGGYVIFTRDPAQSWHFASSALEGVEEIGVGAMDAEWDIPNAALVMKVTAPSPRFAFLLSP